MVSTVDLPATLLDAAGIGVPESSESEVGRVIRTRRWKYFVTDPAAKTRRVPSKRWRRTQARIGTLHVQSASIRRDVLHKATTTLAQQHQVIWVEPSTRSACARAGVPANAA